MINSNSFIENLYLTQNYCDAKLNVDTKSDAEILKTINPLINHKTLFEFRMYEMDNSNIKFKTVEWKLEILDKDNLFNEAFEYQIEIKKNNIIAKNNNHKGRILISDYKNSVIDGASEFVSKGVIDEYDLPPIDTWFYEYDNLLFSWIPEPLIQHVDKGIKVSFLSLIKWIDDYDNGKYKSYLSL